MHMADKIHFRKDGEAICKNAFAWSPLTDDKTKVNCRNCIKYLGDSYDKPSHKQQNKKKDKIY